MLIKTITCHNVYNHGAILQEYALLKFLELKGYNVETINYQPYYLADNHKFWKVVNPKWKVNIFKRLAYLIFKLPGRINNLKRIKNFNNFSKTNFNTTVTKYRNNTELKKNLPLADAYICGSDQIWNTQFENGKDPAFYLEFVPNDKLKISYAASFAIDKLKENIRLFVKDKVSKLDCISVRETSAVNILKNLGINNVTHVLDPVFLHEKEFWTDNFVDEIKEKYILIYDFDSNQFIKKIALRIAKEKKFKIFTLNKIIQYADKIFWNDGPEKFLSLIANAQIIFSNSFHAAAFSIIFQKEMFLFNRKEKINSRNRDLFQILGLSYRFLYDDLNFDEIKSINYVEVSNKLEILKLHSKRFLLTSLKVKK